MSWPFTCILRLGTIFPSRLEHLTFFFFPPVIPAKRRAFVIATCVAITSAAEFLATCVADVCLPLRVRYLISVHRRGKQDGRCRRVGAHFLSCCSNAATCIGQRGGFDRLMIMAVFLPRTKLVELVGKSRGKSQSNFARRAFSDSPAV